MRLIVVDPRHVGLAVKADLWLRVRPGTDGALALGLANLMIERGWYDREFVRNWTNGPHLVRADTGRLLTERDLEPNGDPGRVLAWDSAVARLVPYDTTAGRYDADGANLALDGEYRVATTQGDVVCHPAFELYARLCRRYPPETVEAIWNGDKEAAYRHQLAPTGVTLEQLRAAPGGVRVPLQTRDAKHAEPDANRP